MIFFSQALGKGSTRTIPFIFCLHVQYKSEEKNLLIFLPSHLVKGEGAEKAKEETDREQHHRVQGHGQHTACSLSDLHPYQCTCSSSTSLNSTQHLKPTPKPHHPPTYPTYLNPSAQLATPPALNSRSRAVEAPRSGDAVEGCWLSILLLLLLQLLSVNNLLAGNSNSGPGSVFRNCGNQLPHCKVVVVYTLDFPSSPHVIALVVLPAFPASPLVMFENSHSWVDCRSTRLSPLSGLHSATALTHFPTK